jgi:plasmid stabilization system protein ParE
MRRYSFHPGASKDLREIASYIAADNPDAAHRVVDEIRKTLKILSQFPHQGHRRPDLTSRPLRFMVVLRYLVAYAPDEKPLWIVAILHGHRSPRAMAAILRSRD